MFIHFSNVILFDYRDIGGTAIEKKMGVVILVITVERWESVRGVIVWEDSIMLWYEEDGEEHSVKGVNLTFQWRNIESAVGSYWSIIYNPLGWMLISKVNTAVKKDKVRVTKVEKEISREQKGSTTSCILSYKPIEVEYPCIALQ